MHVWQVGENRVYRGIGRRENDFASSITFGEWQLMAWLVMNGSPVYPLIDKALRVCHPRLARRHNAAMTLNHQK